MTQVPIELWAKLTSQFSFQALLLGNGSSIGLHGGFSYPSLYDLARSKGSLGASQGVFAALQTTDFEQVLRAIWHAELVNHSLGNPSPIISQAYTDIQNALVQTVYAVHCTPSTITLYRDAIASFLKNFPIIVTFNYDVTLYWIMMHANSTLGTWFKDCFIGPPYIFDANWPRLMAPYGGASGATLVFYAHGSLILGRDAAGIEQKIVRSATGMMLDEIFTEWSSGALTPLFVSEGSANQKLATIRRSPYLSTVYNQLLCNFGSKNIAVYGMSFSDTDEHILQALQSAPPSTIAVSVYTGAPAPIQQAFCHRVLSRVQSFLGSNTDVKFYAHDSPGCWRY